MSNVEPENVERKFRGLNNTQESIQSVSLWAIHHKADHEKIVEIWFKVLKKAKMAHRLTLLYLCNDIVQNCKRKHAIVYKDAFKEVLKDATLFVRDSSIRSSIERMYRIWLDRGVYDVEFIDEIIAILNNTKVRAAQNSKLLQDFKPQKLVEAITHFKREEDETERKKRKIVNLKVDAHSIEAIKQLKDRSHGNEFSRQFEDSCVLLEDYVEKLDVQIKSRTILIELLEQSELYYDAQYGEAKIVTNAYKNFGSRVSNLRRKLEDHRLNLPDSNDISSPVIDAPSPGATPPQEADNIETVDMEMSDDESESHGGKKGSHSKDNSYSDRGRRASPESDFLSRLGKHQSFLDKLPKDNSFPGVPWHVDSAGSSQSGDGPSRGLGDNTPVKDEGGGSTPVMDENEEANNAANPIEFLTQIINQSQKSSNSSSFFENLSQLTKTMSSQLGGKKDEAVSEASSAGEGVSHSEWNNSQGGPPVPPLQPPPGPPPAVPPPTIPPPAGPLPPSVPPPLPGSSKSDTGTPSIPLPQNMPPQMAAPPMPPDFSKPPPMISPPRMTNSQPPQTPPFPPNFNPSVPPPLPPNLPPRHPVPPSPGTPGPEQGKWPATPGSLMPPATPPGPHFKPPRSGPLPDSFGQQFPPSGHSGGFNPAEGSPGGPGGTIIPTLGGSGSIPPTSFGGSTPATPSSSHDKTLEQEQLEFIAKLKRKSSTSGAITPTSAASGILRHLKDLAKDDVLEEGNQSSSSSREGKHVTEGEAESNSDAPKVSSLDMSDTSDDEDKGKPISSVVVVKSGASASDKDSVGSTGRKSEHAREWRGGEDPAYHRREGGERVSERRDSGERRSSSGDRHGAYDHRRERRDSREGRGDSRDIRGDPYYDQYRGREGRDYYQQDRYGYDRQRDYYRDGYSSGSRGYPKRPPPPPPPPPYDRGSYYPHY